MRLSSGTAFLDACGIAHRFTGELAQAPRSRQQRLSLLRQRRDDTELLEHAHLIELTPVFRRFAGLKPHDIDA